MPPAGPLGPAFRPPLELTVESLSRTLRLADAQATRPNGESAWYDSRALEPAWQLLPGGPEAEYQDECWQYMGSRWNGRTAFHSFRHRCHPSTNDRLVVWVAEDDAGARLLA